MQSEVHPNYQKKIKDYVISYCPTEFYGKNLHGEIRTGFKNKQNKVYIFRITQLPLTPAISLFLELQEQYSNLSGFARTVHEPVHSSSNHYQPLEYFPRTFHTERKAFKSNAKYMDEYVQKFLRVYAFFYNMRVAHGNLSLHNIGITFDGKVKLMDFGVNSDNSPFEVRAKRDFLDFKNGIGIILEKDDHFPSKFASFNSPDTQNWEHLFSIQHVTSPLQPLYLPRKGYIENIVTVLYKLYGDLEDCEVSPQLRLAVRLQMLRYLQEGKEEYEEERLGLQEVVGSLKDWDCEFFNGVLMGAIQDPEYYGLSGEQRLILICCMVPSLNHEYALFDVVEEFKSEEKRRNQLLGDSLFSTYRVQILSNLHPKKEKHDKYCCN